MKKTLLLIVTIISISSASIAQIEMYYNGGTTDVSGTTIQISPANSNTIVSDINIQNNTGATKSWVITRLRIDEKPTWSDFLCWGHETDPFGGTCYASNTMDITSWTTPAGVTIADGVGGNLQTDIHPDASVDGCATYRYYVHEDGQPYADSVDLEVCFALGLNEVKSSLNVSVAPNPAANDLTINADGVDDANLTMVDVLGNIVLNETILGNSKTIDVSNFRNGIYFIRVESDGVKPVIKKVIVRH